MSNLVIVNNKQTGVLVTTQHKAQSTKKNGKDGNSYQLIYLHVPGRGGKLKQVMQWVNNKNWRRPKKNERVSYPE